MTQVISPALASTGFFTYHAMSFVLLALSAWGWGRLVLDRWEFASRAEGTALRFGVGMSVLSYAVFALGVTRLLYVPALATVVAVGLACALIRRKRSAPGSEAARPKRRLHVVALLVVSGLAIPLLLQPLYPPVEWDATAYHLAVGKLYLQAHQLVVATYLRYPVFPQFQEMLFTLALGLFDDIAANLVSFSMWIGCAVALVAVGRRLGDATAGVCAAGLWLGGPTGLNYGSVSYVDVGLTFFVLLSILSWVSFVRTGRTRWAALAGALAGCAAATKYSGLFFVGALAAATVLHAPAKQRVRSLGMFLGLAVLVASPWYTRNAVLSGDPLFPFLGHVFGFRLWNADDLFRQVSELRSLDAGRTATDLLRLWGRLMFEQGLFVGPEDLFSPALWIPLPLLLIALWKRSLDRTLLLVAFAYTLVWFFTAQAGRYLLPAIPVQCLALGRVLSGGLQAVRFHAGEPAEAGRAGALSWGVAALLALPGTTYAFEFTRARGAPPWTPVAREAFIERVYPSYPAYVWLNRTLGSGYRVYAWRDACMAYFVDGQFMGDRFGPARYARLESVLPDGQAAFEALRAMDVDYFLVPHSLGPVRLPVDDFFRAHAPLVHTDRGARIFAVSRRAQAAKSPADSVRQPDAPD